MPTANRRKRARVEAVYEAERLFGALTLRWLNAKPGSAADDRLYALCARAKARAERRKVAL